ncbi:ABC transporter substrate-binding protein [Thermococcus waiotapuensis]|uniref:ABC transporter substrate-binding protein n=1 Tax=Thermococcus waiotapuensis TaxID=90909 RepID=A0AAE4T3K6_9EURY|nr:ABC transporter substrate-binding protein [Thermococcus waiotapuensis]MDV3103898.1 ABC transporter substrate-binding protein [Thermococcus waiotapuensis]
MKKVPVLFILGLMVLTAGCIGSNSGEKASGELPTVRAATLLGGISTLDVMGAKGLDEKNGFHVEVQRLGKTPDIVAALNNGETDLAVIPAEMAANLAQSGVDIKIISVDMFQNQVIVGKEKMKPEELKGRKIGAVVASGTFKLFQAYMKVLYNLTPNDYTVVNVPLGSMEDSLRDVDAVVVWEPLASQLMAKNYTVIATFSDLWDEARARGLVNGSPVMLVWVVRGDFLKEHKNLVDAFIRAQLDSARYWKANPDETKAILRNLYHLDEKTIEILYTRTFVNEGKLDGELITGIKSEWELAYLGGYLEKDPSGLDIFYEG